MATPSGESEHGGSAARGSAPESAAAPLRPDGAPDPAVAGADVALLRRMAGGDEGALGLLYDRWGGPVYALVLHVVRDAGEAEDVVEEVFWQAWRQAQRFDPERGNAAAWLFTIARS